ncbi:MAG: HupE/UreJ family protein, partial [Desulfobacterales bacterium]
MRHALLVPLVVLSIVLGLGTGAVAHESRPFSLDIKELDRGRYQLVWNVPLSSGKPLAVDLELPEGWQDVVKPTIREFPASMVQRRIITLGETSLDGSVVRFPGLEATVTDVFVRVSRLDGTSAIAIARPTKPRVELRGERSFSETLLEYLSLGFHHILLGVDHLLFVMGLLLIVRGRGMLLKTITSFTLAHSITLGIATLGYASAPLPPLNAAIALSILFLGPEIARCWRGETSLTIRYPWIVAFLFGLLHGFGFASGLSTTGMPRAELPWALLWFNVGVELGQLSFVALILLMRRAFKVLEMHWPIWVERMPGYGVGICG